MCRFAYCRLFLITRYQLPQHLLVLENAVSQHQNHFGPFCPNIKNNWPRALKGTVHAFHVKQ